MAPQRLEHPKSKKNKYDSESTDHLMTSSWQRGHAGGSDAVEV